MNLLLNIGKRMSARETNIFNKRLTFRKYGHKDRELVSSDGSVGA